MPELPEVETTRRGIAPHIIGQRISRVTVRDARLRWPVDPALSRKLAGQTVRDVARRAKYLLITLDRGSVILHLGMSGHLRIVPQGTPPVAHDHVDILFANGLVLRFNDPRRFGSLFYTEADPLEHKLLSALGPEPLERAFDGDYLFEQSRGRKLACKLFIMNNAIVVGVGNIYASESLFVAGIRPGRAAQRVTRAEYRQLATAIKSVLRKAIHKGGTTLRDFTQPDGNTGYFSIHLNVYGREGEACHVCGTTIRQKVFGQRATYWCPGCQH